MVVPRLDNKTERATGERDLTRKKFTDQKNVSLEGTFRVVFLPPFFPPRGLLMSRERPRSESNDAAVGAFRLRKLSFSRLPRSLCLPFFFVPPFRMLDVAYA